MTAPHPPIGAGASAGVFALIDRWRDSSSVALIDADTSRRLTYRELNEAVGEQAKALRRDSKRLAMIFCTPGLDNIICYLAACAAGHAVALMDGTLSQERRTRLIDAYRPSFVCSAEDSSEPGFTDRQWPTAARPHADLALLLSTSGSTGHAKLVRLSHNAVLSNARSIADYLELSATDRAMGNLPLSYAYGLSVLHSHFAAGACFVSTSTSILQRQFWHAMTHAECTSFAGVPSVYEIVHRARLLAQAPDSLRVLTQAGGRLQPALVTHFADWAARRGGKFFVMYGQTEATARISYVPPAMLTAKTSSIGRAIPGGALRVEPPADGAPNGSSDEAPAQDQPPGPRGSHRQQAGELVYTGANVMMGYAESRTDVALGDTLAGELRTGDLGYRDTDGFFFLTGRIKRIAKLHGQRISLDEVEEFAGERAGGPVAVVSDDKLLGVFIGATDIGIDLDGLRREVAGHLGVQQRIIVVERLDALPLNGRGKVDQHALRHRLSP